MRVLQVTLSLILFLGPAGLLWAGGNAPAAGEESLRLARRGEPLFRHYCAHCHGVHGDGDGYNAEFLDKDPAELSNPRFNAKRSNERLFRVIKLGGKAVKKSYLMPAFGHTLSEVEIWSLVAYIRLLSGDHDHPVSLPPGASDQRPRFPEDTRQSIQQFIEWFRGAGQSVELQKQGELLFRDKLACFACHQVDDEGGRVGPDLSRAGYLYKPEWLYVWIRNPQYARPDTKMPNLGVSEEQARALISYLEGLKGEEEILPEEWQVYLEGEGDPRRGEQLFFDPEGKAYCAKCHTVQGQGGHVGPDLSYVGTSRTREFLLESILNPKAVITVGFASVLILTRDGKFLTGVKVNEDDQSLDIVNKDGNPVHIEKRLIKKFKTQKISIMPGNFKDILSVQEIRDILAYLSTLTIPPLREVQAKGN